MLADYIGISVICTVAFCNGIYKQKFGRGLLKVLVSSVVHMSIRHLDIRMK